MLIRQCLTHLRSPDMHRGRIRPLSKSPPRLKRFIIMELRCGPEAESL